MTDDALAEFMRRATDHLAAVLTDNTEALHAAADAVVTAGRDGHLVYATGAGHSLAGVIETFFRAGGLAFVRPLWHPDLLPLNGALASTAAERTPGLGEQVVGAAGLQPGDVLVIFSNSGINHYPVEAARTAADAGATVVAVTSRAASDAAPLRAGARLHELADVVIDTRVPPGDVSWPPAEPSTAPLSSMANAAAWDAVLVLAQGIDAEVPVWRSANVAGPADANEALADRYADRIPEIRAGQ